MTFNIVINMALTKGIQCPSMQTVAQKSQNIILGKALKCLNEDLSPEPTAADFLFARTSHVLLERAHGSNSFCLHSYCCLEQATSKPCLDSFIVSFPPLMKYHLPQVKHLMNRSKPQFTYTQHILIVSLLSTS